LSIEQEGNWSEQSGQERRNRSNASQGAEEFAEINAT